MLAPELVGELAARAARPDFERLQAQLRSTGYCARPVRLRGRIETCDGHGRRRVWSTDTEPDGILRKACGNRREAVCAPCAERYRQDAYHLIAAGLRGGKGVPDTVAEHPALFVTLTAPSFGAVHTRRLGPDGRPRRCRPRRDAPVCEHGVRLSCGARARRGRAVPGRAALPRVLRPPGRCALEQRALGAVATDHHLPAAHARAADRHHAESAAPARARRLRQGRRVPAPRARAPARRHPARPRHARLPRARGPPAPAAVQACSCSRTRSAPPRRRSTRRCPASSAAAACAGATSSTSATSTPTARGEVAGYLAKYATKSTEQAGGVLHRVAEHQVDELPVREHVRRYLRAAFTLAADPAAGRPSARRVRAPARLPRPLPDQEPPLLHDVHRAARGARTARARADPRPLRRRSATRARFERAGRELPIPRSRSSHNRRRLPGGVRGSASA